VLDAVGWVIWLVKIVPEMTYKVSSGTLNLCSLTHFGFNLEVTSKYTKLCATFVHVLTLVSTLSSVLNLVLATGKVTQCSVGPQYFPLQPGSRSIQLLSVFLSHSDFMEMTMEKTNYILHYLLPLIGKASPGLRNFLEQ